MFPVMLCHMFKAEGWLRKWRSLGENTPWGCFVPCSSESSMFEIGFGSALIILWKGND